MTAQLLQLPEEVLRLEEPIVFAGDEDRPQADIQGSFRFLKELFQ